KSSRTELAGFEVPGLVAGEVVEAAVADLTIPDGVGDGVAVDGVGVGGDARAVGGDDAADGDGAVDAGDDVGAGLVALKATEADALAGGVEGDHRGAVVLQGVGAGAGVVVGDDAGRAAEHQQPQG